MRFEGATASRLLTVGFIAAALVSGAWLGLNQMMGAASGLDRVENLTLDWRFLLAGARPAPPGVVIVAIDDQTLSEAEVHALSRETLARLVRAIVDFHPRQSRSISRSRIPKARKKTRNSQTLSDRQRASSPRSEFLARANFQVNSLSQIIGAVGRLGFRAQAVGGSLADRRNPGRYANGTRQCVDGLSGIPRYVPMIFEIPDGVAPSFALAAVSASVGADPVFGPDRIELAGRTTKTDLGYHLPIRYYGPAGSFRRYSAAAPARRRRCGIPSRSGCRRRDDCGGSRRYFCDAIRPGRARRRYFRDRDQQSFERRHIGADAVDPSDRRGDGGRAPRRDDRAHSHAAGSGRPRPRRFGLSILGGRGLSCLCQRLLAQHGFASCDERTADRRLYWRPIPRRAPFGTKVSRGKGDAGQVSVAASGRPPAP